LLYTRVIHSYQALDLVNHPAWNENTMSIVWKLEHSHLMSQHTNRLPFCQTIKTIHCALSLKGCMWACQQAFWERIYARKNKCLLCNFKMIGSIDVNLSRRWGESLSKWFLIFTKIKDILKNVISHHLNHVSTSWAPNNI
jgi:hypothetical protein